MLYVRFSCENSSIRVEVTYSTFLGKRTSEEIDSYGVGLTTREMFYEVRFDEALSLNTLRVIYPIILCDTG